MESRQKSLEEMNPRKPARRGHKPKWPELENNLAQWVKAQCENNCAVSTVAIKLKSTSMARKMKLHNFIGGVNWVYKFMRRNNLSLRTRTTVGQHLPENWEEKVTNFQRFVRDDIANQNISEAQVFNMDEVPMAFNIPNTRTVDEVSTKTVAITTTGHERTCFTVCTWMFTNGRKAETNGHF